MTYKLRRSLDDLNDKAFVWSVLLYKAEYFYSKLKLCFKFPIIILSSAMSIINSNFTDDNNTLKIVNITFNVLTAMLLSIGGTLQIEQKEQEFKTNKVKFQKLVSIIEQKLLSEDHIDAVFVNSLIDQYNNIENNIDFEIPSFICKAVRSEYATKKTLPLCINGIRKNDDQRSKSITMDDIDFSPMMSVIPENQKIESSIVFSNKIKNLPKVIDVKVVDGLDNCV